MIWFFMVDFRLFPVVLSVMEVIRTYSIYLWISITYHEVRFYWYLVMLIFRKQKASRKIDWLWF